MRNQKAFALILVILIMNVLFSQEARHLIISPAEFASAAEELTAFSLAEYGAEREIYLIEDILSTDYGTADTLKLFLENYFSDPEIDLEMSSVLLLGGGTTDWTNGIERNRIPVYIQYNMASDGMFVDFDGDNLPDVAIGRIPASNIEDLEIYLAKYYDYITETEAGSWQRKLLFCADDEMRHEELEGYSSNAMNHSYMTDQLIAAIDEDYIFQQVYGIDYEMDDEGKKPEAESTIIQKINDGVNLWVYTGHASNVVLGDEDYFRFDDVSELSNIGKEPFMFSASCRTGEFQFQTPCLPELLMFADNGGIIGGVFASYDSSPVSNNNMGSMMLSLLYDDDYRWGNGLNEAKRESSASAMNSKKFNLFGDPLGIVRKGDSENLILEPEITNLYPGEGNLLGWNCGIEYETGIFEIKEADEWIEYNHTIENQTYEYNRWRPGNIVNLGTAEVIDGRAEYVAFLHEGMIEGNDGQVICWALDIAGTADFYFSDDIIIGENNGNEDDIVDGVIQISNYPNPFNPSTMIRYYLPEVGKSEVNIYNIKGEKVICLRNGVEEAGWHECEWEGKDRNGKNMSSGIYLMQVRSKDMVVNGKLNLLK